MAGKDIEKSADAVAVARPGAIDGVDLADNARKETLKRRRKMAAKTVAGHRDIGYRSINNPEPGVRLVKKFDAAETAVPAGQCHRREQTGAERVIRFSNARKAHRCTGAGGELFPIIVKIDNLVQGGAF